MPVTSLVFIAVKLQITESLLFVENYLLRAYLRYLAREPIQSKKLETMKMCFGFRGVWALLEPLVAMAHTPNLL